MVTKKIQKTNLLLILTFLLAQDHACKIKRNIKMSAMNHLSEKRLAASMEREDDEDKRRNVFNAERDLQKHFARLGLSLPIPIRKLKHELSDGGNLVTEYINTTDSKRVLLKKYKCLLCGGSAGFWEICRFHHPNHAIFSSQHSQNLGKVIPLCFWSGEGRGPRRSGYIEGTIECPLVLWEQGVQWTAYGFCLHTGYHLQTHMFGTLLV